MCSFELIENGVGLSLAKFFLHIGIGNHVAIFFYSEVLMALFSIFDGFDISV